MSHRNQQQFKKAYRAIRPMFQNNRWRIFPGDEVCVIDGPLKEQTGKVIDVIKDVRVPQVVVEGVNLRKKKVMTGPDESTDFFVVSMEAPIDYSKVALMVQKERVEQAVLEGRLEARYSKANPKDLSPVLRAVRAKFSHTSDGQRVRVGVGAAARAVWDEAGDVTLEGGRRAVVIPVPDSAQKAADANADALAGSKDTVEKVAREVSTADTRTWYNAALASAHEADSLDQEQEEEEKAKESGEGEGEAGAPASQAGGAGAAGAGKAAPIPSQARGLHTGVAAGGRGAVLGLLRQHGGFALRGWL